MMGGTGHGFLTLIITHEERDKPEKQKKNPERERTTVERDEALQSDMCFPRNVLHETKTID